MTTPLLDDSGLLLRRVVARNARRARRAGVGLGRFARIGARRQACRGLEETLRSLRGSRRQELLWGPDLRAWLQAAEEALALARAEGRERDLFERVARGPHLATLLPEGRLDAGFRGRARDLGERLLDRVFRRLPPLLMFLTPPGTRLGPFPLDLAADGEEARLEGELHLRFPSPTSWRLERGARARLIGDAVEFVQGTPPSWRPRDRIRGSSIVLARRLISTRRGLRPGPAVRGLPARLGRALDLVREAWEEAWRQIAFHTRVVVPLEEEGTVSYSLPDRPGTSYINVAGKTPVELADDLLHEAAHHRLHSLEELAPLHRDRGEAACYSPWRRQMRPLHGIVHATYTFAIRAELFQRLLALPGRLPRAWIRREVRREREALRGSLADLAEAERAGLLTPAGSRMRRLLARRVSRLGSG